jgi:hypothetical protein
MTRLLALAVLAGTATFVSPALSQEPQRVEAGRLECLIEGGAGFIIGSSKQLSCTFTPLDTKRPAEAYFGSVNKFGLDVGVTDTAVMQWVVLGPSAGFGEGDLAGDYVGASAEITAAVGAGANVLIGGSGDTVVLQPVSVQAQTGLNLAIGVTQFELRSAAR